MEKEWLKKSPVIRFSDIVRKLKNKEYAKVFVYRAVKSGTLKRITRGLYSTSDNVLPIASNIYYPSYLSFLSASHYYGLTEVIPRVVYVATPLKHSELEFSGYEIKFVKTGEMWGYNKVGEGTNIIFIAELEKLLIDAFLNPNAMGNFEEITNLFKLAKNINLDKLKEYLIKMNSNKIYRQIGFLMEKYQQKDISGAMKLDRNYYQLNPFKEGSKINKKWRLMI